MHSLAASTNTRRFSGGQPADQGQPVAYLPLQIPARSSSSCNPVFRFAFSQNSGDEPHHAGTRSGAQCSNAAITLSLEVIIWRFQFEKIIRAIMHSQTGNMQDQFISNSS
jgi:hypothetical protein